VAESKDLPATVNDAVHFPIVYRNKTNREAAIDCVCSNEVTGSGSYDDPSYNGRRRFSCLHVNNASLWR